MNRRKIQVWEKNHESLPASLSSTMNLQVALRNLIVSEVRLSKELSFQTLPLPISPSPIPPSCPMVRMIITARANKAASRED